MAKQTIGIGTTANDGTGDTLRAAAVKVNENFTELYNLMQIGVFAALTEPAATTVTVGDTYYPINGTFSNTPIQGFELVADPAIQYTGSTTLYFEIDFHATIEAAAPNRSVSLAIKKNGTLVSESVMRTLLKTAGEPQTLSGTSVVQLETGDKIQLVLTCETTGAVITVDNYTTTIKPFILM